MSYKDIDAQCVKVQQESRILMEMCNKELTEFLLNADVTGRDIQFNPNEKLIQAMTDTDIAHGKVITATCAMRERVNELAQIMGWWD